MQQGFTQYCVGWQSVVPHANGAPVSAVDPEDDVLPPLLLVEPPLDDVDDVEEVEDVEEVVDPLVLGGVGGTVSPELPGCCSCRPSRPSSPKVPRLPGPPVQATTRAKAEASVTDKMSDRRSMEHTSADQLIVARLTTAKL